MTAVAIITSMFPTFVIHVSESAWSAPGTLLGGIVKNAETVTLEMRFLTVVELVSATYMGP